MSDRDIQELKDALRDLAKEVKQLTVDVATIKGSRRVELLLLGGVGSAALAAIVGLVIG